MKLTKTILALFLCAAFSFAGEEDITEAEALGMVKTTVKALKSDAPGTIAKINKSEAPFIDKTNPALYAFVYDSEVNMVAHPKADLVGKNFKGKPDVRGKKFRDDIVATAMEKGSGSVEYHYQKPGDTGIFEKITFCEKVKGSDGKDYVVACGKYKDKK